MTQNEFGIIAAALKTYYPKEKLLPDKAAVELWYEELKDIPYDVAQAAIRKWVSTNKWSPSIADIREYAVSSANGDSKDWGKAWDEVVTAIRQFGYCRCMEALDSLSGITRETVDRIGFRTLCDSENIAVDRANFRMIYEQLSERAKRHDQMSVELQGMLENIRLSYQDEQRNLTEGFGLSSNN